MALLEQVLAIIEKNGSIKTIDIVKQIENTDKREIQRVLTTLKNRNFIVKVKESPPIWSIKPQDQTAVEQIAGAEGDPVENLSNQMQELKLPDGKEIKTSEQVMINSSMTSSSQETVDKVLKILTSLGSDKSLKAADISKVSGIGRAAKDVNSLVFFLVKKGVLKKDSSTPPLFSRGNKDVEGDVLFEICAEYEESQNANPKNSVHNHFHDHQHIYNTNVAVGDKNKMVVQAGEVEKMAETPAEKQAEAACKDTATVEIQAKGDCNIKEGGQ